MSRNIQSQSQNKVANAQKPFCGVCHKAGKSIDIYTSHFTKSNPGPSGVVVCPTILTAICTYCKQTGHFKSACGVLKEKERMQHAQSKEMARESFKKVEEKKVVKKPTYISKFAAAFEEDDSDNENEKAVESKKVLDKNFPALSEIKVVQKTKSLSEKTSYASMASKPAAPVVVAPVKPMANDELSLADYVVKKPVQCKFMTHSWADDSYWSDDE